MDIKDNINKIHIDLLVRFDNVKIEEKSNHKFSNYFELTASKGNTDVKMIITKRDLESDTFKWSYYANPLNENSDLVERVSSVHTMYQDVDDIVNNNRFNKEYIDSIKEGSKD